MVQLSRVQSLLFCVCFLYFWHGDFIVKGWVLACRNKELLSSTANYAEVLQVIKKESKMALIRVGLFAKCGTYWLVSHSRELPLK